jgi:hypothetical protein
VVGKVIVDNDDTNLYVTYEITDLNWVITEMHLYVDTKAPKKAAPGRFPYSHQETVTEYTFSIPLVDLGVASGDDLVVAAHAVVESALLHGVTGTYVVSWPGANSYLEGTFTAPDGTVYTFPVYCVDLDHTISPGHVYDATLYSTLDPNAPVDKPENLDLVNYVMNTDYSGIGAGKNEIQAAIWTLVDDITPTSGTGGISWNQAIVDAIVADAYANGEGFVPSAGQNIGVILWIGDAQGTMAQTTLAQTTLAQTTLGDFQLEGETAWGFGPNNLPKVWGWYFTYTVQ